MRNHHPECPRMRKRSNVTAPSYVEEEVNNEKRRKRRLLLQMCKKDQNKLVQIAMRNEKSVQFVDLPSLFSQFECEQCQQLAKILYHSDTSLLERLMKETYLEPVRQKLGQGLHFYTNYELLLFCDNAALRSNITVFGSAANPPLKGNPLPGDLDLTASKKDFRRYMFSLESVFTVIRLSGQQSYGKKKVVVRFGKLVLTIDYVEDDTFNDMPHDFTATNLQKHHQHGKEILTTRSADLTVTECLHDASNLLLKWLPPVPKEPKDIFTVVKTVQRLHKKIAKGWSSTGIPDQITVLFAFPMTEITFIKVLGSYSNNNLSKDVSNIIVGYMNPSFTKVDNDQDTSFHFVNPCCNETDELDDALSYLGQDTRILDALEHSRDYVKCRRCLRMPTHLSQSGRGRGR